MSEIIQNWLCDKLGIILDSNLLSFGAIAKDGQLIAHLLYNYGILNEIDYARVHKTDDYENALQNLLYLNNFLKILGVDYSTKKLESIAGGDGMMALRLFYQLYLILNNKDKLYFITNKIAKGESGIACPAETESEIIDKTKSTKTDLASSAAVYKWHKNNYVEQYLRCNEIRQKYLQKFESIVKSRHVTIMENKKSEQIDEPELLNLNLDKFDVPNYRCEPDMGQANQFISNLKKKSDKFIKEKKLQNVMHKIFLHNLLEKLLENQKAEFIQSVSQKVLKQSYYEKQMQSKLLEVRKQRDVMMYNKKLENDYLMQKKDEKFIAELYQQRHNVTLANLRNDNERKRILELHKRLYKERQERRYKKHLKIAEDVVKDLYKLVMNTLDYNEKYEEDVPDHLWYDWMTLFFVEQEISAPLEQPEQILISTDEIFTAETYKQNLLDDKDMSDYFLLEWPWNLEELVDLYNNTHELTEAGERILGFIVHKVFKAQYPLPLPRQAPLLPKIKIAASIVGCTDENLAGILETILKKKHILIIHMQSAINYCLAAYIKENPEEPAEITKTQEVKKKEKPKKGQKASSKSKTDIIEQGKEVKETQTPKLFPGETVELSSQAKLGEYAHQSLKIGLPLNEFLVANMFIEFLKSLKHIKGWVLLNYPTNEAAAVALESALTGVPIPYENNSSEEFDIFEHLRDELFTEPEDTCKDKRVSKFLPNISQYSEPVKHKSYLNSFIYLREKSDDLEANYEYLQKFYDSLGCDNSMFYVSLDPKTIKQIITLITKDVVFGKSMYDDIINMVDKIIQEKQKEEAKIVAEATKKPEGKKGKKKAESIKEEPKEEIKPPEEEPEIIELLKPGDERWRYIDVPQPVAILTNLSIFWKEVEEMYLNDFKQLFFLQRSCQNAIIPYVHKIFTHMINFIERPDNRQNYVHEFQSTYNELQNDLREDDEFKIEMHCRIEEFKSKLWDICVSKMRESEEERIRIINENWFYEQAAMFVVIYNCALQVELDRCANTYNFLQDYYYSMTPQGLIDSKFNKASVKKYEINDKDCQYFVEIYSDEDKNVENNPLINFLNTSLQESLSTTNSWYSLATTNCKKIESSKPKAEKKGKQKLSDKVAVLTDLEQQMESLVQEYQSAIDGENARIKFRLNLINARARHELYELLFYGENMFHELYSKLNSRYHEEQDSVTKLCEVFAKAVEACEAIQPRLILQEAKFLIDDKELLYDEPLDISPPFKQQTEKTQSHFSITQLSKLADIFFDLTSHDSIPTKSFLYIIEDMVAHVSENDSNNLLPSYWQLIPPEKVKQIITAMYGNVEYVSWKDFIIYNLEIPFPTETELQMVRHQFRELDPDKLEFVNEVQFNMVEFWFENKDAKKLLAKLFKINDERINYALMLLHFCKDQDPIIGLAKAFGLSMGKLICWDEEAGKNYVQLLNYQKYLEEQHKIEVQQVAEDVCDDLIKAVIPEFEASEPEGTIFEESLVEEEINIPFIPELCYTLPFNVILSILTASLPWHYRVQCVQDNSLKETLEIMYESLRNDEFNCVFSHEFLNSTLLKNYLNQNFKFVACSPADLIETELETCTCTKDYNSLSIDTLSNELY